ncbi:MAG: SMC-Scp complex subunit ScpB [Steroidobacteraceae bacterium]
MSEQYNRNVIEAGLLAAGKSLTLAELAQLFDENARPAATEVRAALEQLAADYAGRALELRETASGFRVQVRREFANEVSRLWPERPQRYSRALLETLALIAYRQPITRAEIESVRGVAVNPNIIKTLLERNWIRVVGHRDLPGRPELLGTTREFLDYFGLRNLEELPTLAELRSLNDIDPQIPLPVPGEAAAEPADGVAAPPGDEQAGAVALEIADALEEPVEDEADADESGGEGGDAPLQAAPGLVAAPPGDDA